MKQVARRRSDVDSDEEDEFRAFVFTNDTADDDMVRFVCVCVCV